MAVGVQMPGGPEPLLVYRAQLDATYTPIFTRHLLEETLPWGSMLNPQFRRGFAWASELFPDERLPDTDFYRDWMQPQGLAAEGPIAHTVAAEDGVALAGIAIYRRVGGRRFTAADFALVAALGPHLRRSYALSRRFQAILQRRDALAQVMDRFPQGVILLDAEQRVVTANRRAGQIAALDDGFHLDESGPRADDPRDQARLRCAIQQTLEGVTGLPHQNVLSIRRPSGRPDFGVMVSPLLGEPRDAHEAVLGVFIGDPDAGQVSTNEILRRLYALTDAEAELVRLLAEGRSLDEAAELRGVTRNTARTQLKQVFAKTGTRRQGDLVRLVLSGIASISEE